MEAKGKAPTRVAAAEKAAAAEKKGEEKKPEKPEEKMLATADAYPAGAYGRKGLPTQPEWVLVKNATIWTSGPAGNLESADLLVRAGKTTGQLRMLYVEPSARGLGIGQSLVTACIADARAKGYKKLMLWTNDILVSARKIYVAAGFKLVEEERHHSFGVDLVGQNWELML